MNQRPGLFVTTSGNMGRGVYTGQPISAGEIIEVCPVIIIPKAELPIIHKTVLHDYYFLWGHDLTDCAIALGFGSLYNHAVHANATFILDIEQQTIDIESILDIEAGDEILLNYHGEAGNEDALWF